MINMMEDYKEMTDYYFLIIGSGTEYEYLEKEIHTNHSHNAKIIPWLPQKVFHEIVRASDIGLILLSKSSSVPNYPSRLLTYLTAKIPIIAAVDTATDIGDIIEAANCGVKTEHGDILKFKHAVNRIMEAEDNRKQMGENGYQLFLEEYTTRKSYEIIMAHFTQIENSN